MSKYSKLLSQAGVCVCCVCVALYNKLPDRLKIFKVIIHLKKPLRVSTFLHCGEVPKPW